MNGGRVGRAAEWSHALALMRSARNYTTKESITRPRGSRAPAKRKENNIALATFKLFTVSEPYLVT